MSVYKLSFFPARYQNHVLALLFSLFFLSSPSSFAQVLGQEKKITEIHITVTLKDSPFQEALSIIEYKIPFKFAYSTELALQQKKVSAAGAIATYEAGKEFYNEPTLGNGLKVVGNVVITALAGFERLNPLIGIGLTILDLTGTTDAFYKGLGSIFGDK
ncbi:hypothetical protein [Flavitalea flava]